MILDNRSLDSGLFCIFITINLISKWNIRTYLQENITIAFLQQTVQFQSLCINIQYWTAELEVGLSRKRSTLAAGWWVSVVFFLVRAHAVYCLLFYKDQDVHEVVAR